MRIKIKYPSGFSTTVDGVFRGAMMQFGECQGVAIELSGTAKIGDETLEKDAIAICDPRGVYLDDESGRLLYDPRKIAGRHTKPMRQWLKKNPGWPAYSKLI